MSCNLGFIIIKVLELVLNTDFIIIVIIISKTKVNSKMVINLVIIIVCSIAAVFINKGIVGLVA